MKSQLFKTIIEKDCVINFLKNVSLKNDNHLEINKYCFKKHIIMNTNIISDFYEILLPHYHESKKKYITCNLSYNSLMTVIRQLCKLHKINFASKINYNKSTYEIVYYIYL